MKTDMQTLTDGINELLSIQPVTMHSGAGLVVWEKARQQALDALLQKLAFTPFLTEYSEDLQQPPPDPNFALGDGPVETM